MEQSLHAGPFSVFYQNGFLRYIRLGSTEVLRMVYLALRDENWGTLPFRLERKRMQTASDSFSIQYDLVNHKSGRDILKWNCKIEGGEDGTIRFEISGLVLLDVMKNRAGFCVLHPIFRLAGEECTTVHPGGDTKPNRFPDLVSRDNPFKNLTALRWGIDGNLFEVAFEGDLFETEDQRNWSDASYKTFCTPLSKPFPVLLRKGETITQSVTFRLLQKNGGSHDSIPTPAINEESSRHLDIGIGSSTEIAQISERALHLLKQLKLSHYRVDVDVSQAGWDEKFAVDCDNARQLELPLEVSLKLGDSFNEEIVGFNRACNRRQPAIKNLLLLSRAGLTTNQSLINHAKAIRQLFPRASLGAGTDYNFMELNRHRFDASAVDFISFSIDPQEHATDDLSILETPEAHSHLVRSARQLYPGKQIHVSPITLRRRHNPYASSADAKNISNLDRADSRQQTELCAKFVHDSLKSLRMAGCSSVTLFQTVGEQGIMSAEGDKFPVFEELLNQTSRF